MSTSSRGKYLTKSRFMLAADCATKLDYAGKADYANRSAEDSFLAMLADGGFQVGELARLMYPGGVLIPEGPSDEQAGHTAALMRQEEATIFEAAFVHGGCFARVDVLRKRGREIELIEVKAKSFDSNGGAGFRGAKGTIKAEFLPYLRDLAFQTLVLRRAHPALAIQPFLLLADKGKRATVDGLNQRFRIVRCNGRNGVVLADGTDAQSIGAPILTAVPAGVEVDEILASTLEVAGQPLAFAEAVEVLAEAYRSDRRLGPVLRARCGRCEFRTDRPPAPDEPKSGFHQCWKEVLGWADADFAPGTVLDLWNHRGKDRLIEARKFRLADVQRDDLKDGDPADGLTAGQRQWMQVSGEWPGGGPFFLDRARVKEAMGGWAYPLHFIDFETSAVAVPFNAGRRPYEITAFQFSHHVMDENGRVEHRRQFLEATPGRFPNVDFVRQLRATLGERGTIFRWAAHENTVLRQIRDQLTDTAHPVGDRDELCAFIDSITEWKADKTKHRGPQAMVDLCDLAGRFFFHPATRGSSSLKKVLPAVMGSSARLREIYGRPVYGTTAEIRSLNFTSPVAWWQPAGAGAADPYALLPPIFGDLPPGEVEALALGMDEILAEGGAAAAAYARLQFEALDAKRRTQIEDALRRYCELDTLAMVMVVQAWQGWIDPRGG